MANELRLFLKFSLRFETDRTIRICSPMFSVIVLIFVSWVCFVGSFLAEGAGMLLDTDFFLGEWFDCWTISLI